MAEQILPNLFRVEIPLPNNPLQMINSYVLKDSRRSLVIDTGMNRSECKEALLAGLDEIGVSPDEVDFFVTHMHADHCGLITELSSGPPTVYCSQKAAIDIARLSQKEYWDDIRVMGLYSGFDRDDLDKVISLHPGKRFCPHGNIDFRIVRDADQLEVAGHVLTCLETPGHTTGHVCLYDSKNKLLFSGDHILTDITPNISLGTSYETDLLSEYEESLNRVASLEIDLTLPAHRSLINNCPVRVEELIEHHRVRVEEITGLLKQEGAMDAYCTAKQMTWDMDYDCWDEFPLMQKWFASGEALAHLKHLELNGSVYRFLENNRFYFSLV